MPFLILGSRNTLETHLKEQETNKRKHFVPLGFEANTLLNTASAPNRVGVKQGKDSLPPGGLGESVSLSRHQHQYEKKISTGRACLPFYTSAIAAIQQNPRLALLFSFKSPRAACLPLAAKPQQKAGKRSKTPFSRGKEHSHHLPTREPIAGSRGPATRARAFRFNLHKPPLRYPSL